MSTKEKKHRTTLDTVADPVLADPSDDNGYWVNTSVVDQIVATPSSTASHLAVFFALNWVMTDYRSHIFHVALSHLCRLSGVKTEAKMLGILHDLAKASVIELEDAKGCSAVPGLMNVTILGEIML